MRLVLKGIIEGLKRDAEMGWYFDEVLKDVYEEWELAAFTNSVGTAMVSFDVSLERAIGGCSVPKELRKKVAAALMEDHGVDTNRQSSRCSLG